MQKITPFLWFDREAEEAVKFYVSIFENSRLGSITRYDEAAAQASGRPAGSGVSWQIVPTVLPQMLQDRDHARARRVMEAMLTMKKIDIAALRQAYEGRSAAA